MKKIWRNWPVHNIIGHPLAEIVRWFLGDDVAAAVHNFTVPDDS